MIDWNKSAELNDCTIGELEARFDKYPGSGKMIVRICDGCNSVHEMRFCDYSDLCRECAPKNPEARAANSASKIQYYINNPEAVSDASIRWSKYWSDQTHRDEQEDRLRQFNKAHPEAGEVHSGWMSEWWNDSGNRSKMSEIRLTSEAAEYLYGTMRGGDDICDHHIAYDFLRPDALTVKVTRKFHSQIHNPKGLQVTERGYSLID